MKDQLTANYDRMLAWREGQLQAARTREEPFFMDFPDAWFEDPHWACGNGHVGVRYLKSEVGGCLCLACQQPVYLMPPTITEDQLKTILTNESETRPAGA